jgi:hypothetical protein
VKTWLLIVLLLALLLLVPIAERAHGDPIPPRVAGRPTLPERHP